MPPKVESLNDKALAPLKRDLNRAINVQVNKFLKKNPLLRNKLEIDPMTISIKGTVEGFTRPRTFPRKSLRQRNFEKPLIPPRPKPEPKKAEDPNFKGEPRTLDPPENKSEVPSELPTI